VNHGVRLLSFEERDEIVIVLGDIEVDELNRLAGHLLPRRDAILGTRYRRERVAAEFHVDVPAAQVVHDDNVVALVREVEGGGPAAEAVATEDNDLLLLGVEGRCGPHSEGRCGPPSIRHSSDGRVVKGGRGAQGQGGECCGEGDEEEEKEEDLHGQGGGGLRRGAC